MHQVGRSRLTLAEFPPHLGRLRPGLADVDHKCTDIGQTWAEFCPTWDRVRPRVGRIHLCPMSTKPEPEWTKARPNSTIVGLESATSGPNLGDLGQIWPDFVLLWVGVGQNWPISFEIGPVSHPLLGPCRTCPAWRWVSHSSAGARGVLCLALPCSSCIPCGEALCPSVGPRPIRCLFSYGFALCAHSSPESAVASCA